MIHRPIDELKVVIKCEDCDAYSTAGTLSASLRKFIIHMLEHRGLGQTFETRVRNIAREEARHFNNSLHVVAAINHAIGMHVAEKHNDVDMLKTPGKEATMSYRLDYCNNYSISMLNFIKHVVEHRGNAIAMKVVEAINKVTDDGAERPVGEVVLDKTATEAVLRSEDKRSQPCHRRFVLNRVIDASGISGTGIVAEGVVFSTGQVVLCWLRSVHEGRGSIATYDSLNQCERIHGHDGQTQFLFKD